MKTIALSRGLVAMVDDEDFARLSRWKWNADSHGYANNSSAKGKLYLHTAITGRKWVDHKDGNPLNNCRDNLRPATRRQNCANSRKADNKSSVYKGVTKHSCGKWQLVVDHKYRGLYASELEAARDYDILAVEAFGEFARLNFGGQV